MFVIFTPLLFISCLVRVSGLEINLSDNETCTTEQELDLVDVDHVSFLTVPKYLVKLQLRPQTEVWANIRLTDPQSNRVTYFSRHLEQSEDRVIYSLNNQ